MGWNTDNFSYTQGQIGSTAFNAGCGNGWFWIHTGSPHMFIKGSVNDGGSYSFKFFKPNSSHFGYYLKIYACGVLIFDLTSSDLDNKKCEKTVEGTFSEAQYNADNTLHAYCQANEGCVASVAMTGVTFYKAPTGLSLSCTAWSTKTLTFKASWTAGSKSSTNTISIGNTSLSVTNGGSVTFTGLSPSNSYTATLHVNDGTDYTAQATGTTHSAPSGLSISLTATGKTITPTISWTASSWPSNSYTLKVYYAKSTTASASSTLFGTYSSITYNTTSKSVTISDLINGAYYAVYAELTDKESNITSNSSNVETYKVAITAIDSSTKALKFSIAITNGANKSLQKVYKISGGNAPGTDTNYSSTVIKDNLNHNTSYTISSWISGMSDTLTSITMSTKLFSVSIISSSTGLHNITTEWQAKANGDNYDSDNITGSLVVFGSCSNTGYKHDDDATNLFTYTTPTTNGNISGDYQTNHTLYSTALNYWAWYTITCSVTDGHNTVQSTINLCTQFPYSRMYIGGKWVKVMPYIYTNNKWINSPVHINSNSAWRESDCF